MHQVAPGKPSLSLEETLLLSGKGTSTLKLNVGHYYRGPLEFSRNDVCSPDTLVRLRRFLFLVKKEVKQLLNDPRYQTVKIRSQKSMPFFYGQDNSIVPIVPLVLEEWPEQDALVSARPKDQRFPKESELERDQRSIIDSLAVALKEISIDADAKLSDLPDPLEIAKQRVVEKLKNDDWMDDIPFAA